MTERTGGGEDLRMAEAINDIEGYLLWEAEQERARSQAEEFCARLPWLTDSQREDVLRHYCRERREVSRSYLERVAARSASLRAEYEGVYRTLRRRMVAALLSVGVLAVLTLTALTLAAPSLSGSAPGVP
ncbi:MULTISPECIES: hypothetical protein [Streptomyces]|uniref:hypothetical protein n=1 Tax=Streptomyces TaxID=1883 RepID=UPI001965C5A7|nr:MULTISPECIES: hypothetical protein [Streptomyces]QRX92004.1 hypothetical protein JNO44_15105 [Streptomyces noursei]UJB41768.1 hypothetical protein HRD51_13805 [Streptomyces sp. A1-5]